MNRCLNVIVYYDNKKEIEKYLNELEKISNGLVDICIVVNKDSENILNSIVNKMKNININVIDYKDNVGYLNALLKSIKDDYIDKYEYFILSNTDIEYKTTDFFIKLCTKKYDNKIGCIAPSVFSTNSLSYSNPHYINRISKRKIVLNIIIFSHPFLGKAYLKLSEKKARFKKSQERESCKVYSPHGCYMIFKKNFIKKIKGYEYGAKLYSEESCVGELLYKNGMICYYDNSLKVIHRESSVTGQVNYKKRFIMWADSLKYILKEFY